MLLSLKVTMVLLGYNNVYVNRVLYNEKIAIIIIIIIIRKCGMLNRRLRTEGLYLRVKAIDSTNAFTDTGLLNNFLFSSFFH